MKTIKQYSLRRKLLYSFLVYFFLFLLLELGFRLFHTHPIREINPSEIYHHVHSKDYSYTQISEFGEYGGFEVYFDENGLIASKHKQNNSEEKRQRVFFLGDSFTESYQVPFDRSFTGILSQKFPQIEFKNFGVSSYSPTLYYLQSKYLFKEHGQPDKVIIMLYSNDITDDSTYIKDAIFSINGELTGIKGQKRTILKIVLRQSYFLKFLFDNYKKIHYWLTHNANNRQVVNGYIQENPDIEFTLSSEYLERTIRFLQQEGVDVFLTAVPSKFAEFSGNYSTEEFAEKVERWANKRGINYINLYKEFETNFSKKQEHHFFPIDIHFNETGHKLVAEIFGNFF